MTGEWMAQSLMTDDAMVAVLSGIALGLGMLLSVGPRTLLLIRFGATTRHCWWAAGSGYLSDVVIFLGAMLTIDAVLQAAPEVANMLEVLGIGFLVWCGLRALSGRGEHPLGGTAQLAEQSAGASVMQMLSVSWLNPLVYLEVGLVAGSVSLGFDGTAKAAFGAGYLGAAAAKYFAWTIIGRQFRAWPRPAGWVGRFNTLSALMLFAVAATMAWHGVATGLTDGTVSAGDLSLVSVTSGGDG